MTTESLRLVAVTTKRLLSVVAYFKVTSDRTGRIKRAPEAPQPVTFAYCRGLQQGLTTPLLKVGVA